MNERLRRTIVSMTATTSLLLGESACSSGEVLVNRTQTTSVNPDACHDNELPNLEEVRETAGGVWEYTINPYARCQPKEVAVYGIGSNEKVGSVRPGDIFKVICKKRTLDEKAAIEIQLPDNTRQGEIRDFIPVGGPEWQFFDTSTTSQVGICSRDIIR